jgi:ATP-dependent Lon protease
MRNALEANKHSKRHIWEAMRHVWPEAHWPGEQNFAGIESQL